MLLFFDSFGAEHIPKQIIKCIRNKIIKTNIFRIKTYDSIKFGCFCIGFIDIILKDKSLADFTILFSPNNF